MSLIIVISRIKEKTGRYVRIAQYKLAIRSEKICTQVEWKRKMEEKLIKIAQIPHIAIFDDNALQNICCSKYPI